jgi:hypothetical protein
MAAACVVQSRPLFLERIEAILSDHLPKPVHIGNWFDLIGGTSTGAIIAVDGLHLTDVKRFYLELAPKRPFCRVLIDEELRCE